MNAAQLQNLDGSLGWFFVYNYSKIGYEDDGVTGSGSGDHPRQTESLDSSSTSQDDASLQLSGGTPTSPTHEEADLSSTNNFIVSASLGLPINCYTGSTQYVETGLGTVDLDTEWTDGELYADILASMSPWPDQWNTLPPDETYYAESDIDETHISGSLHAMLYRFCVPDSVAGTDYLITWDLVTWDTGSGAVSVAQLSTTVPGTGDKLNPACSGSFEADPPFSTGLYGGTVYMWVQNVNVTAESNTSSQAPGSGPFANTTVSGGGCSSCGGRNSVGQDSHNSSAASAEFSLGQATAQFSAGSLALSAGSPDLSLATPAALRFTGPNLPGVTVVTNSDGSLRQVNAPQALADIVINNAFSYDINYYLPSQVTGQASGIYQVSGNPFVTWTIENPDASTTSYNRLRITETRGLDVRVYDYTYNAATGSWVIDYPGGVREDATTTTTTFATNNFSQVSYRRTVTGTIGLPGGSSQLKFQQVYTNAASLSGVNSEVLAQETIDPDNNPKTTTYTYYESTSGSGTFRPVKMVVHPDGSWEYYNYDLYDYQYDVALGRTTYVYSGIGDEPPPTTGQPPDTSQCRYTEYNYDPLGADTGMDQYTPRTTINYYKGLEISRSYVVITPGERDDIRCQTPNAGLNSPNNLVTVTKYFTSGPNTNRVQSVLNPDGTMSIYEYDQGTDGSQTKTVYSGQPNPDKTAIIDGTKDVTVIGPVGQMISHTVTDIARGKTLTQDTYGNYDQFNRPQQVTHLDGTTEETQYSTCCGTLDSTIDRDGVLTQYLYDQANRQIGYQKVYNGNSITYTNVLDAGSHIVQSIRVGSDNSPVTISRSAYDLAGQLIAQTNALNGVTTYIETNDSSTGGRIEITINPDSGMTTNYYYADGSLKKTIGTAVHGVRYEYSIVTDWNSPLWRQTFAREIKLNSDGTDTAEVTTNFTDFVGRNYRTTYADGSYSQSFYNNQGQLWKQVDPDNVTTFYTYNAKGELAYTATAMAANETSINFSGNDRITWTTNDVTTDHSMDVVRSRTYVWVQNGVDSPTLVSTLETSTDGLNTWQTTYRDANPTPVTTHSQTVYGGNGSRTVTATAPDNSHTVSTYSYGRLVSSTRYDSNSNPIGNTTYTYDPQGRQYQVTDARNGATTYGYNNADLVTSVTTPNPGAIGGSPETTTTYYNQMLQATNVVQPDGTSVTNIYLLTGELGETCGSRTYPVQYSYDYAGRMKTMMTWQNFANQTGAATTTWNYDSQRGFLTSKIYADSHGPSYTYTPAGRLLTRTWARGITTTYGYDIADDLQIVTYSDGTTPNVTYTYDREGRQSTITRSGMTDTLTYNLANQLLVESYSGGLLNGLSVTSGYDTDLRRTSLSLNSQPSSLNYTYSYDNASRLQTVSDGNYNSATYSYVANSPLVGQITFTNNGALHMTTTKQYDYLNRLTQISSANSQLPSPISYAYAYNNADQRTRATLADGSYWLYQYDSLGQLTSAHKYWSDETPVAGQQFDYNFDTIGNRTQTKVGGDQNGLNQRAASYTANNLNQYSSRDVPGYLDIKGVSFATNTVTVNGTTAYRKVEYFRAELSINNSSSPLWQNITASATGQNAVSGNVFVPQTPEQFTYDFDGNLTGDGRWSYTWDAENRLIEMTSLPNAPAGSQLKLDFAYDWQGRRIQKIVSTWNGNTYVPQSTSLFLYDGWNLIATLTSNFQLLSSYVWGNDLSGSSQGAGGVGGLLEVSYRGAQTTNCFAAYDGNGNVVALVNTADGTAVANYEYGPFGEVIRASGPMAKANPFRFSTKYQDDESDLLYYGYRYYSPSTGRWPNRDSIQEQGGLNLYQIVNNNPISNVDNDGRLSLFGVQQSHHLPFKDTCGEYAEDWYISLDKTTPKSAYIVQEIDQITSWTTCNWYGRYHHYVHLLFWEIEQTPLFKGLPNGVIKAGTAAGYTERDEWYNFNLVYSKYGPSSGIELTHGESHFYYVTTTGILNWGPIKDPETGTTVTTEGTMVRPLFWGIVPDNGEAIARHSTIVQWNCCCGANTESEHSIPPLHDLGN